MGTVRAVIKRILRKLSYNYNLGGLEDDSERDAGELEPRGRGSKNVKEWGGLVGLLGRKARQMAVQRRFSQQIQAATSTVRAHRQWARGREKEKWRQCCVRQRVAVGAVR